MKIEKFKNGNVNIYHMMAEPGYIFKRISDGKVFGDEMTIAITYYLFKNDEPIKLDAPLQELPEHYVEIEDII